MVLSTTAAGTISQTARGFSSFFTKSASDEAPTAFSSHQLLDRLRRHVEDHALMAACEQPPHHVGAHAAKSDHSELHSCVPFVSVDPCVHARVELRVLRGHSER